MSLMLRSLLSSVLMVMSLAACATLPKPNPGTAAKLQAANASLDTLTTDLTTFYGNLEDPSSAAQNTLWSAGLARHGSDHCPFCPGGSS